MALFGRKKVGHLWRQKGQLFPCSGIAWGHDWLTITSCMCPCNRHTVPYVLFFFFLACFSHLPQRFSLVRGISWLNGVRNIKVLCHNTTVEFCVFDYDSLPCLLCFVLLVGFSLPLVALYKFCKQDLVYSFWNITMIFFLSFVTIFEAMLFFHIESKGRQNLFAVYFFIILITLMWDKGHWTNALSGDILRKRKSFLT